MRAARRIPYYRDRFGPAPQIVEDTPGLPITTRDDVRRRFPEGFVPEDTAIAPLLRRGELRAVRSLTRVDRLEFFIEPRFEDAQQEAMFADHATLRALSARRRLVPSSYWPIPSAGVICVRDMPAMDLRVDPRFAPPLLRLVPPEDPSVPSRKELDKLFLEMESHGTEWLDADGAYLALATAVAEAEGLFFPRLAAITVGLASLARRDRKRIEDAWGCPVIGRFGSPELGGHVLYECAHRALHVNEPFFWWEVLRDGRACGPGELGELVLTTLGTDPPLIRYATGHWVERGDEAVCACGSPNRVLRAYAGHSSELLVDRQGAIVSADRLDAVIATIEGIERYRAHQAQPGTVHVRVRAGSRFSIEALADAISKALALTVTVAIERIQADPLTYDFPLVHRDQNVDIR